MQSGCAVATDLPSGMDPRGYRRSNVASMPDMISMWLSSMPDMINGGPLCHDDVLPARKPAERLRRKSVWL